MICKTMTRTLYQTVGSLLRLDTTYLCALHYMLYMGEQADKYYTALNPLGLMPSTSEMIKLMNDWQEFRVKKITLTWIPSVKGNPRRVETGLTIVDNAAYLSYIMYMWFPPHSPARYNLGGGVVQGNYYLTDTDFYNGRMLNEQLDQMQEPRPVIKSMNKSWSVSWRAMVPKQQNLEFTTPNTTTGPTYGPDYEETTPSGLWRPFPWTPFLNSGLQSGSSASYLTGLTAMLRQPFMAMRNDKNFDWVASGMVANGMYGRWKMTSTWEFRKRRNSNAYMFTAYDNATTQVTVTNPSVHPPVPAMTTL